MWDATVSFFQEYKYQLGIGYLCYIVVNIIVMLMFRIRHLERKLRGQGLCCGDQKQPSLPKEHAEENEARKAVSEDWVTTKLERNTSDPNFHAIVSNNSDEPKESDHQQGNAVEEWRCGIERIVKIKRLVDTKAEELAEDMSFEPGRELHPFFKELVTIIQHNYETKKLTTESNKKEETPKSPEVVKSSVKKSAIPTPERKAPFMEELSERIARRRSCNTSPEKTEKVD